MVFGRRSTVPVTLTNVVKLSNMGSVLILSYIGVIYTVYRINGVDWLQVFIFQLKQGIS